MTEHPILFSALMVRAILEGKKTQTRRVVKPQPKHSLVLGAQERPGAPRQWYDADCIKPGVEVRCPFGRRGDRLWVRETWLCDDVFAGDFSDPGVVGGPRSHDEQIARWRENLYYRADAPSGRCCDLIPECQCGGEGVWRPSIHMPRWASRILLEVTEVRAQRLQDITEADAKAEGVELLGADIGPEQAIAGDSRGRRHADHPHTLALAVLWDTINGARAPWASNPWVWCVSFRRTP